MPNASDLEFYSGYPIDKISVEDDPFTVSVVTSGNPFAPTEVRTTRPNTFGVKGFTTLSFSSDSVNYYDQSETLQYFNAAFLSPFTQLSVTSACDDTTIYFYITSAYDLDQTCFINYTVDSLT